jgi:sugar/nucleoside kinase (ribokinase family)
MKKLLPILFFFTSTVFASGYQVLGLGSPCIDYIVSVGEEELARLQLQKGGWREIESGPLKELMIKCHEEHIFTGDCTSNTIKGLASLGVPCGLTGRVGNDTLGRHIRAIFNGLHVATLFSESGHATDQIACLVTPDGERSFCGSFLAHKEISEKDLVPADFEGVKLVHMEGYHLINGTYMETSMKLAKAAGAKISLDLANTGLVKKFRERILGMLETYADILFANEEEAFALTHLPPEKSAMFLKNYCPLVIVKVAEKGCWVCSDEGLFHAPGIPTNVVDTTGAGDIFASAFLYAHLNGYSLRTCADMGNLAGSAVVAKYGAELPLSKWEEIRQALRTYQN